MSSDQGSWTFYGSSFAISTREDACKNEGRRTVTLRFNLAFLSGEQKVVLRSFWRTKQESWVDPSFFCLCFRVWRRVGGGASRFTKIAGGYFSALSPRVSEGRMQEHEPTPASGHPSSHNTTLSFFSNTGIQVYKLTGIPEFSTVFMYTGAYNQCETWVCQRF